MMVVEKAPEVASQVMDKLFEKINKRIKDYMDKQTDWEGVYDFDPNQREQETTFAPKDWPKNENGEYLAYYQLLHKNDNGVQEWLSVALGLEDSRIVLIFNMDESYFDGRKQKKQTFENLSKNPRLVKSGFSHDRNNVDLGIYLPFFFQSDKIANEYPDFDESLVPLDESLNALIRVHDVFNDFVKKQHDEKITLESME
jgi:hypothetical protein